MATNYIAFAHRLESRLCVGKVIERLVVYDLAAGVANNNPMITMALAQTETEEYENHTRKLSL